MADTPALAALSLALAAAVIGLGAVVLVLRVRLRYARRYCDAWQRNAEQLAKQRDEALAMPTFGALDAATNYELGAEVARRMPDTGGKVIVTREVLRDGVDVDVMPFGLDACETVYLLHEAIEKAKRSAS